MSTPKTDIQGSVLATSAPPVGLRDEGDATEPGWLGDVRTLLGASRVSTRPEDQRSYSRDMWTRGLLSIAAGVRPSALPAAICWPESAEEIQALVRLAKTHHIALVPFGAGSGVAGGVGPLEGALVIDCKRMRRLHIDEATQTVTFEPGLLGIHLEEQLNRRGFTLGHFPSSIMCSTVGGWLATRGAGQMSTKYGKIEDMVQALEVVTRDGELLTLGNGDPSGHPVAPGNQPQTGPDWVQLLVGSEGTLGFITRARCVLRKLPQARKLRGYFFANVDAGCQAIQHLLQQGVRPAVVRLYDELDTLMSGAGRHTSTQLSGPSRDLGTQLEGAATRLLQQLGARIGKLDLGTPDRPPLELEELLKLLKPDAVRARSRVEKWLVQTLLGQAQPVNRLVELLMPTLGSGCLLILGFEGEPELVEAEDSHARQELVEHLHARDLGEEPGNHWLRHRYDVSYKLPKAFAAGAFADTIEVAASWDRIGELYRQMRAALSAHALVMAHFSHAYPDGCSIYFTVIARAVTTSSQREHLLDARIRLEEDRRRYDTLWQAAMQASHRVGGTLSHHHGVGRMRAPYMQAEHGASLGLLRALKHSCDPWGLWNPGNLLPPATDAPLFARSGSLQTSLLAELQEVLGERAAVEAHGICCTLKGTHEAPAIVRLAASHHTPVIVASQPIHSGAAHVRLDLAKLTQVGPVHKQALRVEAECGATLLHIEQTLRMQGLSLGRLPPWSYARTLGAALAAPCLSEACLDAGRLRDRKLRISATLPTGQLLLVPPSPVPRRAAGPDLAHMLIGSRGHAATLLAATLRLVRHETPPPWVGFLFQDLPEATAALHWARAHHGHTAFGELLLVSRELLLERLAITNGDATLPAGKVALLASGTGPSALSEVALRSLRTHVAAQSTPLAEALCAHFWHAPELAPETLTVPAWTPPPHELALSGDSQAQATLLAGLRQPWLICGVHVHGMTLCGQHELLELSKSHWPTSSLLIPSTPALPTDSPRPSGEPVLWPVLLSALQGNSQESN